MRRMTRRIDGMRGRIDEIGVRIDEIGVRIDVHGWCGAGVDDPDPAWPLVQ
jgi:hypothetical protein